MGAPDPVAWALAALMLGVSGYHLVRLAVGTRREVDVDATHLAMGVAMAVMLAGWMTADDAAVLAIGFTGPTAWFAVRATHGFVMSGARTAVAPLGRLIGAGAMVYMLARTAADHPMPGMSTPAAPPAVTVLLLVALAGACVPQLARPSIGAGCQVAMSATAAYMLIAL